MQTVTRRALLGGGAVAASGVAAIGAGQTSRGKRWLHSVGIIDSPDIDVPDVSPRVEWNSLPSRAVRRDVSWGIAEPARQPEATLLCLHGRNGSERAPFDNLGVHRFVAAADLPWVVVAADGGRSSYWHRRRDGTDPMAMLFDEVLPAAWRRIGSSTPLLLMGWSMGGYGALLAARDRASEISAVAASSPAVWRSFGESAPGAFDDADDFGRNDLLRSAPRLAPVGVRLDCGRDDPFARNVRVLAERIPNAESRFPPGFHDDGTWRSFIPDQLRFLRSRN